MGRKNPSPSRPRGQDEGPAVFPSDAGEGVRGISLNFGRLPAPFCRRVAPQARGAGDLAGDQAASSALAGAFREPPRRERAAVPKLSVPGKPGSITPVLEAARKRQAPDGTERGSPLLCPGLRRQRAKVEPGDRCAV